MQAIVKDVEIRTVPFTSGNEGEPWDLFSGPDLYYEIHGPEEECLHTSDVASDVHPTDLPVGLGGGFAMEPPARYVLQLLDADLTSEEVIAQVAFIPARWIEEGHGSEPPRVVRLADGDTALQLTLSWNPSQP